MIKLQKSDRSFRKFVYGCRYDGGGTMAWLDKLKTLRTEASLKLLESSGPDLFEASSGSSNNKNIMKKRKQRGNVELEMGNLPSVVELQLPSLVSESEEVGAINMKVATCFELTTALQIEMVPEALEYIRHAILSDDTIEEQDRPAHKRQKSDGAFWREDRKAYVARRMTDDGPVYQTFRPDGDDEIAKNSAKELAQRWANGEDVADGDNNDADGRASE